VTSPATRHGWAIVGAGVAGLACARRLAGAGIDVTLYDKGRRVGGRLATRRITTPLGTTTIDHGGQFLTVRGAGFSAAVDHWSAAGACAPWTGRFVSLPDSEAALPAGERRIVGTPSMQALAAAMAAGLTLRQGVRVLGLNASPDGWTLTLDGDTESGPYSGVVIAIPAEQAAPLLATVAPALAREAALAVTAPCWAGLLMYERDLALPFDAARVTTGSALAWVAREASKPGRDAAAAWLVHASPAWSSAHLEDSPEHVAEALSREFGTLTRTASTPIHATAHRWRYAQVQNAIGTPFGWDLMKRIGTCGDWRLGARIELAWQSGDALGEQISLDCDVQGQR
jgi:renalase